MNGGHETRSRLAPAGLRSWASLGLVCSMAPALLGAQVTKPKRMLPAPGHAAQPAAAANTQLPSFAGCAPNVYTWWRQSAGTGEHGRIVCAADPTRPAILLVHGNHQDGRTWTAPSYTEYAYDYKNHPGKKRIGETHDLGNAGVYKVGTSNWLYGKDGNRAEWDKANNWFDFLAKQGFTVATWSQDMLTVSDAMPSTREVFDSFLAHTAARSPGSPPPVALVAHSRGGLLIRQILKEKGSKDRVKWVVTLHSPHAGSELGRTPGKMAAELVDLVDCCAPAWVTAPFKPQLKTLMVEAMRPMTKLFMADENRELQPNSPLFRRLAEGEKKLPDVAYYTFGGTNPTVHRVYMWFYDAESAVPQYSNSRGQYFVWRAVPREVEKLSPILDEVRNFAPEVTPGQGDALVSDASSKLPWSVHTTTDLNHAELLWNKPLMRKVAALIEGPVTAGRQAQPTLGRPVRVSR